MANFEHSESLVDSRPFLHFGIFRSMHAGRLLPLLLLTSAFGCGSSGPFDYVRVSGKVSYEDGSPIPVKGLRLRFAALDAPKIDNAVPRPGIARVDDKGEFSSVTSYKPADGLIPGKHKVALEAGGAIGIKVPVPQDYQSISTTPLVVDTADAPFDIKVPKPKGSR
ncbi:MAG: hypothetical protein WD468_05845 [Pirellulales bacterium]